MLQLNIICSPGHICVLSSYVHLHVQLLCSYVHLCVQICAVHVSAQLLCVVSLPVCPVHTVLGAALQGQDCETWPRHLDTRLLQGDDSKRPADV